MVHFFNNLSKISVSGLGFNIIYLCPIFEEDAATDPKNISPRQKKSKTNNPKNPYRMSIPQIG